MAGCLGGHDYGGVNRVLMWLAMQQPAQKRAAQHHTARDQVVTPARILGAYRSPAAASLCSTSNNDEMHLVSM